MVYVYIYSIYSHIFPSKWERKSYWKVLNYPWLTCWPTISANFPPSLRPPLGGRGVTRPCATWVGGGAPCEAWFSSVLKLKVMSGYLGMGQNLVPLVNIKIAGKWMFIPLKMVLIGIDPYPFRSEKWRSIFQNRMLWITTACNCNCLKHRDELGKWKKCCHCWQLTNTIWRFPIHKDPQIIHL